MRLLIDRTGAARFAFRTASAEYGDTRRYYCAAAPLRAILVCRNGLELTDLIGRVVDAQVGNDPGWRDFVREGNAGVFHTKITVYRRVPGRWQDTLSRILDRAPRED